MIEPRPLTGNGARARAPVHADCVACPKCGTELEIAEVLADRIRADLRKEIMADARAEAERRTAVEKESWKQSNEQLEGQLREAKKAELAMRQKMVEVERDREDIDLTVERRVGERIERTRAEEKARAAEEHTLKLKEKDEQIASMLRQIEDLKRKASQGSQQTQGEALEVDLEDRLREAFPSDVFEPVPKGIRGADLVQRVCTPAGAECGTILWEAKRTKNWTDQWLPKLRDDQRALKAEFAALVSVALPKASAPVACVDNVWVSSHAAAIGLASALRVGLIETARSKQALVGRSEKMEVLYGYLSGPEFRNRIEGLLEPFQALRADLEAEKRAMQRLWAKREKQIERAMGSTSGLYGDMQGIVGAGLPELEGLDLPKLEEGE